MKRTGYVTTGQAAELLRVSKERVKQLADEGRLGPVTRDEKNGARLLLQENVERFARDRRQPMLEDPSQWE